MLGWLNPSAVWALPLIAVPVIVHLLRTHHAKRVAFPTLRFVQPSRTAAVRMRLPSDVLLMCVRIGVVALAVAGLAQPILLTAARVSAWDARIARAVVVDSSASMRARDRSGVAPEVTAAEAAEAESRTATYAARFDVSDIEHGLVRASRWLSAQPPARREVVIVSDLQRGQFKKRLPDLIPRDAGLRFVRVGRADTRAAIDGVPLLGVGRGISTQRIDATPDTTSVAIDRHAEPALPGFRIIGPPESGDSVARLLDVVAVAGAHAGSDDQPIVVRLQGAPALRQGSIAPLTSGWMLRTALRLSENASLVSAAAARAATPGTGNGTGEEAWATLARGEKSEPLVRAAAFGRELVLDVAATPDDIFSAVVVQAALDARPDPAQYDEHEVARTDDQTIAGMTRTSQPVTRDAWRAAETSDARWCWLLALVLLGVEQWLRARGARHQVEEAASAAA